MLRKIIALSLVTVAFAGLPAAADDVSEECTVDVGTGVPGVGTVGASGSPVGNLGSCEVVTLDRTLVVTSVDPADGCSISYDATGDGLSNTEPEVGQTYEAGTTFHAFCDAGVVDGVNSLTLHEPAE